MAGGRPDPSRDAASVLRRVDVPRWAFLGERTEDNHLVVFTSAGIYTRLPDGTIQRRQIDIGPTEGRNATGHRLPASST